MDIVQYGLNMFDRRREQDIFPYCLQQGTGVMVYGPLAFGLLTGTLTADTTFGSNDWRSTGGRPGWNVGVFAEEHFQRNLQVVEGLQPLAAVRGKGMPHLALHWVLSNPAVSCALVGTRTVQEVEDNVVGLEWALSGTDMAQIDDAVNVIDTRNACSRRMRHGGRLNVIWDNAPAHRGEAVREYLRTPGLDLTLLNLPGYSPDFNADEAIWGWAREEATGNLCLGTKALVQEKVSGFLTNLSGRGEEVQRRCRTVLQSRAEGLLPDSQTDSRSLANAHPTLALV